MKTLNHGMVAAFFVILTTNTNAALVAYTDQAEFLTDLAAMGYTVAHEGFESDSVWGGVRTPDTAESITNLGITWTSNNLISNVTTSTGAAHLGDWGFYSSPHGSYTNPDPNANCSIPGECGDGFRANAVSGVLYGIGGWIDTNIPFAKLGMFIGTYPNNPVDFGETCDVNGENCFDNAIVGTTPAFFGVIDDAGFAQVEFRELEGKTEPPFGGDLKNIFSDDFYFAGSDITAVPIPAATWLFGSGLLGLVGVARHKKA